MPPAFDLTGQIFGRLRVIRLAKKCNHINYWLCLCDKQLGGCNKEIITRTQHLRNGNTKSCGCLARQRSSECRKSQITHNMTHSKLYTAWENMVQRCTNPKYPQYRYWGGRGIKICDEWLKSAPFLEYVLALGWTENCKLEIDRIDNNGNYEPGNVRLVTREQNARNRRVTIFAEYNGIKRPLSEWCKILSLPYDTMYNRIGRQGWSATRAFTTPCKQPKGN